MSQDEVLFPRSQSPLGSHSCGQETTQEREPGPGFMGFIAYCSGDNELGTPKAFLGTLLLVSLPPFPPKRDWN